MPKTTIGRLGLVASVVAGVLAVASSFLVWSKSCLGFVGESCPEATGTTGIEGTGGKIVLAAGILVLAAGIAWGFAKAATIRWIALLAVVGGAIALLVVGIRDTVALSGEERGLGIGFVTDTGEVLEELGFSTSVGIGLWLTIAAGALAAVGAILALLAARGGTPAEPAQPVEPTQPAAEGPATP